MPLRCAFFMIGPDFEFRGVRKRGRFPFGEKGTLPFLCLRLQRKKKGYSPLFLTKGSVPFSTANVEQHPAQQLALEHSGRILSAGPDVLRVTAVPHYSEDVINLGNLVRQFPARLVQRLELPGQVRPLFHQRGNDVKLGHAQIWRTGIPKSWCACYIRPLNRPIFRHCSTKIGIVTIL